MPSVLTTNDVCDSADGAYDSFENYGLLEKRGSKITIPPRESAKLSEPGGIGDGSLSRNKNIRAIHPLGRALWKKRNGYHRRSIAEKTLFRYKTLLSSRLSAIRFDHQAVEAFIKCNALNKMTHLGMPESYALA